MWDVVGQFGSTLLIWFDLIDRLIVSDRIYLYVLYPMCVANESRTVQIDRLIDEWLTRKHRMAIRVS